MRAVLDTNVYVSAFLFGGKPAALLQLAERGAFVLLTSAPLRQEVEEVLALKFQWPDALLRLACEPLWNISVSVDPSIAIDECRDPDDNRVLECALEGEADCIVSGDKHLLELKQFRLSRILTVSEFLRQIGV
jgi:putative PIN family toxin of toxin-antitoxin system